MQRGALGRVPPTVLLLGQNAFEQGLEAISGRGGRRGKPTFQVTRGSPMRVEKRVIPIRKIDINFLGEWSSLWQMCMVNVVEMMCVLNP